MIISHDTAITLVAMRLEISLAKARSLLLENNWDVDEAILNFVHNKVVRQDYIRKTVYGDC